MKRILIALIVFAAVAAIVSPAFAQRGNAPAASTAAAPAGPTPKTADGHPDLSGVWWRGSDVGGRPAAGTPGALGGGGGGRGARGGTPPATFTSLYQPWAAEKAKTLSDKDDPTLRCVH